MAVIDEETLVIETNKRKNTLLLRYAGKLDYDPKWFNGSGEVVAWLDIENKRIHEIRYLNEITSSFYESYDKFIAVRAIFYKESLVLKQYKLFYDLVEIL